MVTGTHAKELLETPVFTATINELSQQIQDETFNTAVNEIQKRQDLFMLHRALGTLVNLLKASASTVPLIQDNLVPDDTYDLEQTDLTQFFPED